MSVCFVFLPVTLIADVYHSVVMDRSGQILEPLEARSIEQLRAFQAEYETYYLLPAELVSLYQLTLPMLSGSKARTAVMFFLEHKSPQRLAQMHFAYAYDAQLKAYRIAVIDKARFQALADYLAKQRLMYRGILIDASLLKTGEMLYHLSSFLVHADDFTGAIPLGLEGPYQGYFEKMPCLMSVSEKPQALPAFVKTQDLAVSPFIWLAQRFFEKQALDLCQGEFSRSQRRGSQYQCAWWALWCGIAWVTSLFMVQGVIWLQLAQVDKSVQQQLIAAYQPFFPDHPVFEHPRAELEQRLQQLPAPSRIWALLRAVGTATVHVPYHLDSLQYQNKILTLTLTVANYHDLNALQSTIQQAGVTVHKVQVKEEKDGIATVLELS